jgi:hypothetical protein
MSDVRPIVTANEFMDEYMVAVLQRIADESGANVKIVASRAKPKMVAKVLQMKREEGDA